MEKQSLRKLLHSLAILSVMSDISFAPFLQPGGSACGNPNAAYSLEIEAECQNIPYSCLPVRIPLWIKRINTKLGTKWVSEISFCFVGNL